MADKVGPFVCLGNASATCGTSFQNIATHGASDWKTFVIGSDSYLAVANQYSNTSGDVNSSIYKWMPAGTPSSNTTGCFGNGTTCGTSYQDIATHEATDWEEFTIGSDIYLGVTNEISGGNYATNSSIYKWQSSGTGCPSGGGFGNGTTCGTAYQNIATTGAVNWKFFTVGSDKYLAVANHSNLVSGSLVFNINSTIYKWQSSGTGCPTGGGFGNGTTCGTALQNIATQGALGWEPITIGSDTYFAVANNTSDGETTDINSSIYKAIYTTCLGKDISSSCGTPLQSLAPNTAMYDLHPFTIGSDTYLAGADYYDSAFPIYKWISSLGCLGKDASSACGTAFQSIAIPGIANTETVVIGSDTYLAAANGSTNGNSPIYKWMPAGTPASNTTGCFGSGSICGAAFQNIATQYAQGYKAINISGATYLVVTNEWNGGGGTGAFQLNSSVYKWMPAGTPASNTTGCFGSGSVCGTAYQNIGTAAGLRLESFVGPDSSTYLAISNYQSDTVTIYKWITSGATGAPCFGKAGACANSTTGINAYQTISNAAFDGPASHWDIFSIGSDMYFAMPDIGASGKPGIYKWITSGATGAPCFGKAGTCGAALQAITPLSGQQVWGTNTFAYGPDTFLVTASSDSANPTSQGTYVWMPAGTPASNTTGCFGNRSTCGSSLFSTSGYGVGATPFTVGSALYVGIDGVEIVANGFAFVPAPSSPIYAFLPGTPVTCSVKSSDPSGNTSTLASGNSSTGILTGALTQVGTYTYTLDCGIAGSVSVPVTVANPAPTISITSVINAAEPSTNGSFVFHADVAPSSDLTINYTVGGTATPGVDYTALSGSAVIPAGQQNSAPIPVSVLDDSLYEGSETLIVQVTSSANYIGTPSATITIADNETASSLPTLTSCVGTASGSCSLGVTPSRVRSGNTVTVTWDVTGLVTGANGNSSDSCTITRNPVGTSFPQSSPANSTSWVNTTGVSSIITQATAFKLTCTAPDGITTTSVSQSVSILPSYQEI